MIFSNEFLQRCREITNHYESFDGPRSIDKQILKIYEEVNEIHKAKNLINLTEECCDVILATITVFDLLGIPYDRINSLMETTLQKVEKRIEK